jgi:hypothetical protein
MPREDRRVYFNAEEIYKALYTFCVEKELPKPVSGSLHKISTNLDNSLDLDFYIENGRTGSIEIFTCSKDFTIAALMHLCIEHRIPLPKGVNKTLEVSKDSLVLRVQLIR